ncbi:MAG: hypothetical protein ACRD5K_14935 [Candidatus Acidiferrales bacterium]
MCVLTCAHCGEPIDQANGVWFHPRRRFQGQGGSLPTMCDFGDRVGPSRATPMALSPTDKDYLYSIHVSIDEESFLLEALWLDWQQANRHRGDVPCADCGAADGGQHSLDCERHAQMKFNGSVAHHTPRYSVWRHVVFRA